MNYNEPRKVSEATARQVRYAKDAAASTARARKAMEPAPDPEHVPSATELQVAYARRFHNVKSD